MLDPDPATLGFLDSKLHCQRYHPLAQLGHPRGARGDRLELNEQPRQGGEGRGEWLAALRRGYTDILLETDVDACLQVYTAPFDPTNPNANRVGQALDDLGTVELQAGQDYYFVVQALEFGPDTGEYFYVLAPPAPFRINKALAGGWFNSEVNGQGFLLDVYENINFMFLAWFTFDASRPDAGVPSTVGEAGQRWLTAQGAFQGDSNATTPAGSRVTTGGGSRRPRGIAWSRGRQEQVDSVPRVDHEACAERRIGPRAGSAGPVVVVCCDAFTCIGTRSRVRGAEFGPRSGPNEILRFS